MNRSDRVSVRLTKVIWKMDERLRYRSVAVGVLYYSRARITMCYVNTNCRP